MRPTRGSPENGEGRSTRQGVRPSGTCFPARNGNPDSTDDHHSEALFASLALDLLADTRRHRGATR